MGTTTWQVKPPSGLERASQDGLAVTGEQATTDERAWGRSCIYFTDPWTSPAAAEQWDLTFAGVYRVTPDLGTLTLLVGDFVLPNGLAFTPDE